MIAGLVQLSLAPATDMLPSAFSAFDFLLPLALTPGVTVVPGCAWTSLLFFLSSLLSSLWTLLSSLWTLLSLLPAKLRSELSVCSHKLMW